MRRIERLHHIGRQLAVLKRIYQSYAMIINRILDRQKPTPSSLPSSDTHSPIDSSSAQELGVPLSSAAIVRFERLRDRINLFALSEIQDCLDEKESLVFLVRSGELFYKFTAKTFDRTSILSRLNSPRLWSASPALLSYWQK